MSVQPAPCCLSRKSTALWISASCRQYDLRHAGDTQIVAPTEKNVAFATKRRRRACSS